MNALERHFNAWLSSEDGTRCLRYFEQGSELRSKLRCSLLIAFLAGVSVGIDHTTESAITAVTRILKEGV